MPRRVSDPTRLPLTPPESDLRVTGVTKAQAQRAIQWLKARNLLAFYRSGALCAFEFKHGRDWTHNVLRKALEETR